MLDTVDLDTDMSAQVASNIAVTEMSGTAMVESSKKLAVLVDQERLTREEYRRVVFSRVLD